MQEREKARKPAKTAAKVPAGPSSVFPEFPPVLPRIPLQESLHFSCGPRDVDPEEPETLAGLAHVQPSRGARRAARGQAGTTLPAT